jgi:hypothetical protein
VAEEVTIGFRGSEEYRRRLQQAALDRGLKVQGLIETAVESYLAGAPAKIPAGHEVLIVRADMAAVLRAMAQWLETAGPDKVLDTLTTARALSGDDEGLKSSQDGQVNRRRKELQTLKPA